MIRILESKQVGRLFARRAARLGEAEAVVRPILEAVRKGGDRALLDYARKFDGLERKSVRAPPKELAAAASTLSTEFRDAVKGGSANIRESASMQMPATHTQMAAPSFRLGHV